MEMEQGPWGMVKCQGERRYLARAIRTLIQPVRELAVALADEIDSEGAARANVARPGGLAANIRQCRKASRISWLGGKKNFRIS
jgi:hypothetical protein